MLSMLTDRPTGDKGAQVIRRPAMVRMSVNYSGTSLVDDEACRTPRND
jgi:hypothetical protein